MSDAGRITAGGIELVFQRRGDRIAHAIQTSSGQSILISHEEQEEEPWPISPPFQQLHFEQRSGGIEVALLVGMAGSSHWSMSCEADPEGQTLTFDVAVRVKRPPQRLGSQYDLGPEITWDSATRRLSGLCEIRLDAATEKAATRLCADDGLVFTPVEWNADLPITVQWRYLLVAAVA